MTTKAELLEDVLRTARELGIDVAEDGVAGTQMLQARWEENDGLRVKREGLKDEHEEAKVDVETAEGAFKSGRRNFGRARGGGRGRDGRIGGRGGAVRRPARPLRAGSQMRNVRRWMRATGFRSRRSRRNGGTADSTSVRVDLENTRARLKEIEGQLEQAILKEKEGRDALDRFASESEVNRAIVERESATAQMHAALERYLELALASDLLGEAMAQVRAEQQDPLVARAAVLFAAMTEGEFAGIETDVDENGLPVVKGKRANGETEPVAKMSDGTRDQLFLAFRLASLESYGESAEPLPFVADDILIHFDDPRSKATLRLLAEFGKLNQVLLFTHHESVRDAAARLVKEGRANIIELAKAA